MAAPPNISSGALAVVRFRAGDHEVAVEAARIAAMRTSPEADAVAIEALMGLDVAETGPRRWLMLRGTDGACIEVGEPVRLDALPVDHLHPLPPLVAARQALRGIAAIAITPDGAVLVLDLDLIV